MEARKIEEGVPQFPVFSSSFDFRIFETKVVIFSDSFSSCLDLKLSFEQILIPFGISSVQKSKICEKNWYTQTRTESPTRTNQAELCHYEQVWSTSITLADVYKIAFLEQILIIFRSRKWVLAVLWLFEELKWSLEPFRMHFDPF